MKKPNPKAKILAELREYLVKQDVSDLHSKLNPKPVVEEPVPVEGSEAVAQVEAEELSPEDLAKALEALGIQS